MRAEIDYWLHENARRRQTGMHKQCLKRQDIHRALTEKGFSISYSCVCKYIQRRKAEKAKEVFFMQYYEPCEECEFDWGEVKLRIDGNTATFTTRVDFAREGRSIVMYGNPGTGKTHIAIGLGIKACLEGYSVFFTSIPHLLTLIREAKTEKILLRLEMRFERFCLVFCDEFGYVGSNKKGAEMLFNNLSLRTGKKETIITINLPFTRWE